MLREIENLLRTANKARGKDIDGNLFVILTPGRQGCYHLVT